MNEKKLLTKSKEEKIFAALKKMEKKRSKRHEGFSLVFMVIENKNNQNPLYFFLESGNGWAEIRKYGVAIDYDIIPLTYPMYFYAGNYQNEWSLLSEECTKEMIQTNNLDPGDHSSFSISILKAESYEEKYFLSIYIASIILSTSMEKIIEKMGDEVPHAVRNGTYYLYDYI